MVYVATECANFIKIRKFRLIPVRQLFHPQERMATGGLNDGKSRAVGRKEKRSVALNRPPRKIDRAQCPAAKG
jgi:hypothetical protein